VSKHALEGNAFRYQFRNLGKVGKIGSFFRGMKLVQYILGRARNKWGELI